MSRGEAPTLLSLDRFARIMGINPVHFSGAVGTDIFPIKGGCSDVWFQKAYIGADRVSRDDLAQTIANVEEDIARYLGYWPAPMWLSKEVHRYPRHHRPDVFDFGSNSRGDAKSLQANYGRIVSPGRRATTFMDRCTIVWSDPDGDGFDERATITLADGGYPSSDRHHIKVYPVGESSPEWEVRPARSLNFVAGNIIIELDFWQVIEYAQQDPYPTGAPTALDIADATIYYDELDVYYEYTDTTQTSAQFYWEPRSQVFPCTSCGGTGCECCTGTTQDGCIHTRDTMLGIVVPQPSTWTPHTAEEIRLGADAGHWNCDTWARCYSPDEVYIWYYAGEQTDRYLAGLELDPLSRWFAEAICWMTVARLERNFCQCGALEALQRELRSEMSRSDAGGPTWFLTDADGENPFGTKVGELRAWKRLRQLAHHIPHVAVV